MNKNNEKLVIAVLSALSVVMLMAVGIMYRRVRVFNDAYQCDVFAGSASCKLLPGPHDPNVTNQCQNAAAPKVSIKMSTPKATSITNTSLTVERIEYDGDRELQVVCNERPDMEVVKNYIKVTPLIAGSLGFRYTTQCKHDDVYEGIICITGEYAYRTNVTLRILKGLPLYGKGANPMAEGSLTNDVVYVFNRKDPKPVVAFADDGRYLPPGGRKALRIEALSVTNVATSICRVEPRNIVQLLAREEKKYSRYQWGASADDELTLELSGASETGTIPCAHRPCEKEICQFPIALHDGGSERGVFLATIRNGDLERDEDSWRNPRYNPNLYRLVCMSDLGLSVRRSTKSLGVWVTSLTTGQPLKGAHVAVYSSANILLAEGDTDGNGWCEPTCRTKGEPFAVVVWTDSDMTFMALRDSMQVDETYADGLRADYLKSADVEAFLWTERGIYRHGEPIFAHALLRNDQFKAPSAMPITLTLRNPNGNVYATKTLVTDAAGALVYDGFSVADEQPSGKWRLQACLPGECGDVLSACEIKIEEFAPPQIRVRVESDSAQHPSNFTFKIAAEHLFGGPARTLSCEGAVVFEDVPFAPERWEGFTFGNDQLGLRPCFRRLSSRILDENGICAYEAPLWADSGRPKAAVRATGQGIVFEDGGRPATARKSIVCHYYPYYIGTDLPNWLKCPKTGSAKINLVCVDPKGTLRAGARKLVGKIDRIDSIYSYRKNEYDQSTWDCERVRTTIFDSLSIAIDETGRATYTLPMRECGDYVLMIEDPTTGVSFGRAFYLSDWGDDTVRAPLNNPTEVALRTDKAYYRVGERPRLVVKAPFTGYALLSVMRDDLIYDEILNLTNATSEVLLRPVERAWAPNVDVSISVIQSVNASVRHLAARAHGMATVRVRPAEHELDVKLNAEVALNGGKDLTSDGSRVTVQVEAPHATSAVVTLVDEGINLLTGEPVPDPVEWFAQARTAEHPLYDLFGKILPVVDDGLKASGIKTGGGFGAEMLGCVSPVPTRRFKPLALWNAKVNLADGKGQAVFDLPEFVGEVRVTALAYSATATGAASVQKKISPKLVMQPDAPRFVAPEDEFQVTLPLRNTSPEAGTVRHEIAIHGTGLERFAGQTPLSAGGSTNVCVQFRAIPQAGEMSITFTGIGLGETHQSVLRVPVRPAVASRQVAGVAALKPSDSETLSANGDRARFWLSLSGMPFSSLVHALDWLAEYPHGCLEQTASRIFPLLTAGGVLNAYCTRASTNRADCIASGVRRVESMIRADDFVMWPDCSCAPWDREVSLYAAHFLLEAEKSGYGLRENSKAQILKFLRKWALDKNDKVSAYACHTLALTERPEKDRMFRLFDAREKLDALSRARLARAFVAIHDRKRAEALMKYAIEPQSVKEAAFVVLALVDLDPSDARIPPLVKYLESRRDKQRLSWGTTSENAHALMAMGAYLAHHATQAKGQPHVQYATTDGDRPPCKGALDAHEERQLWARSIGVTNVGSAPAFLSWRRIEWPPATAVTNEANGLFISRRYLRADGSPADMAKLVRGEMLIAELTITSEVTRVVSDLVIEDLFAGAFEPVHRELDPSTLMKGTTLPQIEDWIMRKDARDDRMRVFSKSFTLKKDHEAKVFYPVRVVSAGDYILPGPSVEGMYSPQLRARCAPGRIVVRH